MNPPRTTSAGNRRRNEFWKRTGRTSANISASGKAGCGVRPNPRHRHGTHWTLCSRSNKIGSSASRLLSGLKRDSTGSIRQSLIHESVRRTLRFESQYRDKEGRGAEPILRQSCKAIFISLCFGNTDNKTLSGSYIMVSEKRIRNAKRIRKATAAVRTKNIPL